MSERVGFIVAMLAGEGKKSERTRHLVALLGHSTILAGS
jgi:hypothetical protein